MPKKELRMCHVYVGSRVLLMGLAVSCSASLPAQEKLAPVKDLPHTIGSASKTRPLMFCAIPDASIIPAAYDAAVKNGKRPFVIGWELKADPPKELARIVLITSLPQTGS